LRPDRGKSPDFSHYLTRNQQESRVVARQKGDLSARQPAADVCRNTLAGLAEAELAGGSARAVVEMNKWRAGNSSGFGPDIRYLRNPSRFVPTIPTFSG
jgi:hypothetical protein